MANLNFVNAGELVEFLQNQKFNMVKYTVTVEPGIGLTTRLSPALYWTGKEVIDEIHKMDQWISELAQARQALVNLIDREPSE